MATNRNRRGRTGEHTALDNSIVDLLLYGTKPDKNTPAWTLYLDRHFDDKYKIKAAWKEHGPELMKMWQGPGVPWAEAILSGR